MIHQFALAWPEVPGCEIKKHVRIKIDHPLPGLPLPT